MNFNKILGYFLLFLGLAVIGWSLYASYNIFTGQSAPPALFETEESKKTSPSDGFPGDVQKQMEQMIRAQFQEMIPTGGIPKILNLISWSMLAGVLIFGGSKISVLGIRLIKE